MNSLVREPRTRGERLSAAVLRGQVDEAQNLCGVGYPAVLWLSPHETVLSTTTTSSTPSQCPCWFPSTPDCTYRVCTLVEERGLDEVIRGLDPCATLMFPNLFPSSWSHPPNRWSNRHVPLIVIVICWPLRTSQIRTDIRSTRIATKSVSFVSRSGRSTRKPGHLLTLCNPLLCRRGYTWCGSISQNAS